MVIRHIRNAVIAILLLGITNITFAEDAAPVYDADSMPPQFDGQSPDVNDNLPTPPAPQQESQPTSQSYSPPQSLTNDQRLGRIEQQVNNLQHSDSSAKTDQLQNEVQTLRGQVDTLTHQTQQLQTQLRTMYSDVDKRLNKQPAPAKASQLVADSETTDATPSTDDSQASADSKAVKTKVAAHAVPAKPVDKPPTVATDTPKSSPDDSTIQPNVAEEQQTYQTAYDLIKAKKYNEAIAALQGMLQKYPSGQFAANAHYWLGELYGLVGKNDQSAAEFSTIIRDFPDSPKVADAQFKLGLIYAGELKWSDARLAFKKVVNKYPGTTSARLASEQLKQIKKSSH